VQVFQVHLFKTKYDALPSIIFTVCKYCLAGPLAASSISLLKLLSLMLEDNPVEIKQQLEQSKLLQTFIELVIRGMVLTRNKVHWFAVVVDQDSLILCCDIFSTLLC